MIFLGILSPVTVREKEGESELCGFKTNRLIARQTMRLSRAMKVTLLLFVVVFEPGLNTPRITLVWMRRLRVHLFSITPPHRQMHSDFRGESDIDFDGN